MSPPAWGAQASRRRMSAATSRTGRSLSTVNSAKPPAPPSSTQATESARSSCRPAVGSVPTRRVISSSGNTSSTVCSGIAIVAIRPASVAVADPSSQHEVANAAGAIVGHHGPEVVQQHGVLAGSVTLADVAPRQPVEVECRVGHPSVLQEVGHLGSDRRLAHTEQAGQRYRLHMHRLAESRAHHMPDTHAPAADTRQPALASENAPERALCAGPRREACPTEPALVVAVLRSPRFSAALSPSTVVLAGVRRLVLRPKAPGFLVAVRGSLVGPPSED